MQHLSFVDEDSASNFCKCNPITILVAINVLSFVHRVGFLQDLCRIGTTSIPTSAWRSMQLSTAIHTGCYIQFPCTIHLKLFVGVEAIF